MKVEKKNPENSCYGSGVETLLCYLELHPQRFVELLHPTLSVCKISCYDGPRQLRKVTKMCESVFINIVHCSSFILFGFTLISVIDALLTPQLPPGCSGVGQKAYGWSASGDV